MGRLSHIEDVEQREAEQQSVEVEQVMVSHDAEPQSVEEEQVMISQEVEQQPVIPQPTKKVELQAEEDEVFHGVDSTQPMGLLHKVLIAVAVVVVVIAIVYIVNSWIPFI